MSENSKTKNFGRASVFLFLIFWGTAQNLFAQGPPANSEKIYLNACKTALANGSISSDERAMLYAIQQTLGLSDQEAALLISQLQSKLGYQDQSGRWFLVAQNMVFGSAVYGWMVPDLLGAEEDKYYIGSEMISLAGAFYLTYIYTKDSELSHARAQMIRFGSLLGLRLGFAANTIFELDNNNRKTWEAAVMAAIPIGAYVGDYLFKRWSPSHGQSWALSLGAGIGAFSTSLMHASLDQAPKEPDPPVNMDWSEWEHSSTYRKWKNDHKKWQRLNTVIELAGYPLGIYLARTFWGNKNQSFGDAIMLTQGALSGSFYGVLLAQILGMNSDDSEWQLLPALGMPLGAALMDRYIDGYDYSPGQGLVSVLGTASGISFMAGLSVLADIHNSKVVSAGMLAGGIGGLLLTDKIFNLEREDQNSASHTKLSLIMSPSMQFQKEKDRLTPGFSLFVFF